MAELQYYLVLFLVWFVCVLLLKPFFKRSKRYRLPPSPPSLPIIGHIHHLHRPLYKGFRDLSDEYGPLLYLRLGVYKCVLISSSSLGADIFKSHDLTLSYKPKSPFENRLMFGNYNFFNAPYGEYWRFMKKLCMTELLGARHIQRSSSVRQEELTGFLRKMLEKARRKEVVDVNGELTKYTNDATSRMIMSTRCSSEDGDAENCRELVINAIELARKMTMGNAFPPLKKLFFLMYGRQVNEVNKNFDDLLEKKWKEHDEMRKKGQVEEKDLMDILLDVFEDDKAEHKISRTQCKAFIVDLFVGGTSTSAETMQWAMAQLLNYPETFKKVREEVESVVGNRLVQESDLPNLPFLQAVVKETLRLFPALPIIPRVCHEDIKVGEYEIPKDTAVLINSYALMRDPEVWEDPSEFRPERFLLNNIDQKDNKGVNFEYLPFGVGRRSCPGSNLAQAMIGATIGAMVQCFDWELSADEVNMEVKSEIITDMVHPLMCVPVVHFNPFDL